MKHYQRMKTTLGHRYYVRMADDEVAGRIIYRTALVVVPFLASALMFLLWVKMG